MDYMKAVASINRAVIAALISAGVTVITTIVVLVTNAQFLQINLLSFVDVAVILGLAFGVYKKSRVCAVLLLIYYIAGQISVWLSVGNFATFPMTILFCYFYIQGVRGTVAYHNFVIPEKVRNEEEKSADRTKHPVYGIVSFALGVLLFITILIVIVIFGGTEDAHSVKMAVGLLVMASLIFSLAGILLGVVGLVQKHRRRVFSLLGLIMNGVFIMLIVVSVVSSMG